MIQDDERRIGFRLLGPRQDEEEQLSTHAFGRVLRPVSHTRRCHIFRDRVAARGGRSEDHARQEESLLAQSSLRHR